MYSGVPVKIGKIFLLTSHNPSETRVASSDFLWIYPSSSKNLIVCHVHVPTIGSLEELGDLAS